MKLSALLANEFPSEVQRRGHAYYHSGYVRLTERTPWLVQAFVQGGARYQVTLSREDALVSGSCTCPYPLSHGMPCKHLWATILAAEAHGSLQGDGRNQSLYFTLSSEDDLEDMDDLDEGTDVFALPPSRAPSSRYTPQRIPVGGARVGQSRAASGAAAAPWKQLLASMLPSEPQAFQQQASWPVGRQLLYLIDVPATLSHGQLVLELAMRDRLKKADGWGKVKAARLPLSQLEHLPEPLDRQILATLRGAREHYGYSHTYYDSSVYGTLSTQYVLPATLQHLLVPLMCQTGRCWLRLTPMTTDCPVLRWDDGAPWHFHVRIERDEAQRQYVLTGVLQRQGPTGMEQLAMTAPAIFTAGGLLLTHERVARFEHGDSFAWIPYLRRHGQLAIPFAQGQAFLSDFLALPQPPPCTLPPELQYEEVRLVPQPRLTLRPLQHKSADDRLCGEVAFQYGEQRIRPNSRSGGVYNPQAQRFWVRHRAAEEAALATLHQLGFKEQRYHFEPRPVLTLATSSMPRVVRQLAEQGWVVEAEGKLYRRPGAFRLSVRSGIDWFELHGDVDFDGVVALFPTILAALLRGDTTVRLGDGTYGLLPEEWLKKYSLLAGLGSAQTDHVRFTKAQAGLLDALLAAQPDVTFDATFAHACAQLQRFQGIKPADPPAAFHGTLRAYQRDGLGWLHFLRQFGFGGCLADEMGLGKTVQVLALLASRRHPSGPTPQENGQRPAPSLVVVPRSLMFNWQQEATRFTPHLRVLDHTGQGWNKAQAEHFDGYDVILTTYGTPRKDAVVFKDFRFDYVILDEAQAIKNAETESAKAARLLQGDYKLALSGTPIENHLGELWSLCGFLNPGMLGAASAFTLGGAAGRHPDPETRHLLAQALRPFILRRTKAQVARDLPAKIEQTIFCELEPRQRKLYDALREHYRRALLGKVAQDGINTSKIMILEALLRLRQAACHPGLLDAEQTSESSAKLDVLIPKLIEAREEGSKTVVFSQFTSLLAIVRERLDNEGMLYAYLDGRTRNRQERVERFQTDPHCPLFLISLKAGGLGLNLTAAENVFLLDPWWNPAVEAQAIDRTHRIGQTKQVFACRLIAKDTVEEKVLELQHRKRDLADAIITADNSLIRNLTREDLELLLA
jgi:superfamily II DNA or RNA helicase